jgi:hypothetical protein
MQQYSETEPYGTVALDGPIVPATNDMWVWRIGRIMGRGETSVPGEKLPYSHYVNSKSHTDWIQAFGKIQPTDNLSYTTACKVHKHPLK